MENNTNTAVITPVLNISKPVFSILVKPVASNQEILEAWRLYQELKTKLLTEDDFVKVNGQEFPKKSAYRKLALAFGVSVEITKEKRLEHANNIFAYEITAKAFSPNGRFMMASAACNSNEKRFSKPSDVRATAQTRATNRAISDLLGGIIGTSSDEVISDSNFSPSIYKPFYNDSSNEEVDDCEMSKEYFESLFSNKEDDEQESNLNIEPATEKQTALIIKLAEAKCKSEQERSSYLKDLSGISKTKASQYISQLLQMTR